MVLIDAPETAHSTVLESHDDDDREVKTRSDQNYIIYPKTY